MDVIELHPRGEINQLNRLLEGINKKRQSKQDGFLKALLLILSISTLSGFLVTNWRLQTMMPGGNTAGPIYIYAEVKIT